VRADDQRRTKPSPAPNKPNGKLRRLDEHPSCVEPIHAQARNGRAASWSIRWTRLWDDETKTPWLIAPDRSMVIGQDDAESVALKARWARERGPRGVFFWQIAADRLPDGSHPLQEAVRKGLGSRGGGN
jgi:GH18 family chitinase